MLNAAIWGFGMIGESHRAGYEALAQENVPVRLAAICDNDAGAFTGLQREPGSFNAGVRLYEDVEEMLAAEQLDIIDICLPSYLHREAAMDMLRRGYHVLSEKPMGLSSGECADILRVAEGAKGSLMIGHCLRFYPQYQYLKQLIDSGVYGKVASARLERLSMTPSRRGTNWFLDYEKSGGCLLDLHIHDVDMVRYLFGEPHAVSARAVHKASRYDAVDTRFDYGGMAISACGDWTYPFSFGFRPYFRVVFERATVVFENYALAVYEGTESHVPDVKAVNGITREIEYLVRLVETGAKNTENPPEDSAKTVALMETIKQSADANGAWMEWN